MERKGDKRKRPGVKSGKRASAHKKVEKNVVFDAPGGKILGPAMLSFDFHLKLCPNESTKNDCHKVKGHAAKEEAWVMVWAMVYAA